MYKCEKNWVSRKGHFCKLSLYMKAGSMIRRNNLMTSKLSCHSVTFLSVLFSENKVMHLRSAGKKKKKKAGVLKLNSLGSRPSFTTLMLSDFEQETLLLCVAVFPTVK